MAHNTKVKTEYSFAVSARASTTIKNTALRFKCKPQQGHIRTMVPVSFNITIDDIQPARMFFKAGYKNMMTRGFPRLYVFHQAEESQRFLHHEQAHMDKKEICSKRKQGRFTSLYINESQHSQYAYSNLLLAAKVDTRLLSASRIDTSKQQDSVQHDF